MQGSVQLQEQVITARRRTHHSPISYPQLSLSTPT